VVPEVQPVRPELKAKTGRLALFLLNGSSDYRKELQT
jgi:hypothetical protein